MAITFLRTIILYIFLTFCVRLMGKKQVAQLEPVEFVIILLLSELVAIPMQDMDIALIYSIVPVLSLVALEITISLITMKLRRTRMFFQGKPTVLIEHGKVNVHALEKNMYNIDELMEEIRNGGYSDIRDIEFAILETGGRISIIPSARSKPASAIDVGAKPSPGALPYVVVNDGKISHHNLKRLNISEKQFDKILSKHKISDISTLFFAVLDTEGDFYYQLKGERP